MIQCVDSGIGRRSATSASACTRLESLANLAVGGALRKTAMLALGAVIAGSAVLGAAAPAQARDRIRIVGSSTVFPFSTAVAEKFGRSGSFQAPVVESTGTGGGIKLFCGGVGDQHPDIANASRRIKASEIDACKKAGVNEIVEIKFGFDGIVLSNSRKGTQMKLTKEDVFMALAKQVPVNGVLVPNPHKKWSDIGAGLPDQKIEVLGPPPTSGTRDAFVELVMEGGAAKFPSLADLKKKDEEGFKRVAHAIREDGIYIEAGENDNLIVQKLDANPLALGIFGYSFLEENGEKLQGSLMDGVAPTFENIASGKYGVSRALFFYVKKEHVKAVPGIAEYVAEFMNERAVGEEGYLADKGLIPLPKEERERYEKDAVALRPMNPMDVANSK
jgi:phosphate transport system substrate-binding protein